MTRTTRSSLAASLGLLGVLAFLPPPAFGESAWWHLTSGSRPANMQSGVATSEVEKLTVSATSGTFNVARQESAEQLLASVKFNATPAELQTGLGELYGAGNVAVTGGPLATGTGNLEENSKEVTGVTVSTGAFALGQEISGEGIPAGAKIEGVGAGTLTLSRVATETRSGSVLSVLAPYLITFTGELAHQSLFPIGVSRQASVTRVTEGKPDGEIVVTATNVGGATAGSETAPVRILDTLPPGLRATRVIGQTDLTNEAAQAQVPCKVEEAGLRVSCTFKGAPSEMISRSGKLVGLPPFRDIEVRVSVEVGSGASSSEENKVSVSGGEAPGASLARKLKVSSEPTRFGVEDYELTPEEAGGALDTQAGSHPFQTGFTIAMNQLGDHVSKESRPSVIPPELAKDLRFKLPPGLVGNPTALPQCSIGQFLHHLNEHDNCPAATAIGVASVAVKVGSSTGHTPNLGYAIFTVPVFNVEPQVGEPARFGFFLPLAEFGVLIDTSVRSGGDYGVTSTTSNIAQTASFLSAQVTLWGVPGDPRHDSSRGWNCLMANSDGFTPGQVAQEGFPPCTAVGALRPPAFLDLPTSCTGPLQTSVEADSWREAGVFHSFPSEPLPSLDGCNHLQFVPQIRVTPDGQQASKPTGLTVDIHVPQEGQLNGGGLAQSNIKDVQITLPEGVTQNPSAADGLQACSEAQVGYLPGESHPPGELHFTPKLPGSFGSTEALQPGVNFCPDGSKIAEVTIHTPLLPNPVKGFMYLASPQNFHVFPQENPFETHIALYIVAEDPVSGSLVKLPGKVELGGEPGVAGLALGQIRSTFEDNPQLPFEDAEVRFFGGERAPLATPSRCGSYTTNATFTPWSGGAQVSSSSTFQVTSGPNGTPCPGASLPFSPSLASGTTNNNAGSFSALTTTLSRPDGNQNISSVTLHYPPGVSGVLKGVLLCPEAQANTGTCGPESQIGETVVSVGLGGDPFAVTGGKVYITEKYQGAPFGISIVNPAKAGPFNLQEGRPVVVRAKIEVDPSTAALTITTDPAGSPHAIPTIIEGFPLQIQHVNVLVNRPGFTFNPTNCTPTQVTGAISGDEGASSAVANAFQVTNCAVLKFAPKFTASTQGHTSKQNGASLHVGITSPGVGQAGIHKVELTIPAILPSRLTTLQKACVEAQFNSNPAGCPAASDIATAVVHTPLLNSPLTGPVYFVSHGGAAFPDTEIILQGEGVKLVLVGHTDIKKGVTHSRFETVPDAPFTSFEFNAPEGPYSIFGANGNLCQTEIRMPTTITAQNGAVLSQSTLVEPEGCPNKITILSHSVKKRTITLKVAVPSAGKLTVGGKGLSTVSKTAGNRGTITLTLHARGHGKLNTKVKLTFTPAKGRKLTAAVAARIKR